MRTSSRGWQSGLLFLTLTVALLVVQRAEAQSIRIHTGGFGGGFHLGINSGPSFGYGSRYGYGGYGYPGYGLGYGSPGIGFGIPYSSYRYGYPTIYDTYRAQSMYRDYRADYYDRMMSSYQYGIQRDLMYDLPHYQSPYLDPLIASPYGSLSYRPPVAQIDPLLDYPEIPNVAPGYAPEVPIASLPESLRAAATRLSASLSRRHNDGEIWLDYLSPGRIIQAIDQGLPAESLRELMRSYDGVVGNPELRTVANADGFAKTRQLLRQWLDAAESASASRPAPAAKRSVSRAAVPKEVIPDKVSPEPADVEEPAPEESILEDADVLDGQESEAEDVEQVPAPPKPPRIRVSV